MNTILVIILLSFLSGITTLIGVWFAFKINKDTKFIVGGLGFSAGIMLLISFFELLPESIKATTLSTALISLGAGCLLIFSLNFIIPHTHLIEERGKLGKLTGFAFLVAFGLILHDFPEGFAMANSFIYKPALGVLVALSIAIHNIPEEYAMAVPLILTGKKKLTYKLAFLSALAEPTGAVVGLIAVSFFVKLNPVFMAFAAGAMIFISVHELIPFAVKYKKPFVLIFGFLVSMIVYSFLTYLI